MTSKHTPGPWRACKAGACQCGQVWSLPTDAPVVTAYGAKEHGRGDPQFVIAAAHSEWGDGPDMIYGIVPEDQREANARLIAASPDMLGALKGIDAILSEHNWGSNPALLAVRAAIAKAEGKS